MNEMVKIAYQDYEKISDICMWLSKEYVLKFNVELNKHTNNNKENFHKEIGYSMNGDFRVNINRSFNYYLSIESVKRSSEGLKLQLRIGVEHIYFLKFKLHEVIKYFTSEEYKSLFVKKDNKIIMTSKVPSVIVNIAFNNYIEFEPVVATFDENNQSIGIRLFLGSDGVSFFMDVNTLLSFSYFIDTFNMYQSAQLMLNYLGRPENGTNYFGMNNKNSNNYVPVSNNTSTFFDRVNAKKK
mgnify:CR=1 FL=1